MRRSVVIFLVTAFLVCPGRVRSQPLISVLVPAYANPCCSGGPAMWSSLLASAADPQRHFELSVIFNPASGPGVGRDPNFLDGAGHGPLASFRAAGGIAHGYVATGNATRSIVDAKADIDAYLTGQYAGFIDGIFFDEMSNNLADVSYYRELQRYVHTLKPGAQTFGNPGTPFVTNPSGQTAFLAADYIGSLDTIVAFENSGRDYLNAYTSFPFLEGLEPRKLAHILHSQGTWNTALLTTAAARGAGYLYVTDDLLLPNPYDALSGYWPQFTADVSAFNVSAVPLPATYSMLLVGVGLLSILRDRRTTRCAQGNTLRMPFICRFSDQCRS